GMWDAVPAMSADASAFLNKDFDTRFGVGFNSWSAICGPSGSTVPCVAYPTPGSAMSTPTDGTTWAINPFLQGCGSSQFPSNATFRGDFADAMPVQARCQHFGLRDGANGTDEYELYTASTSAGEPFADPSCGGGWQIYWRQSMPGYM